MPRQFHRSTRGGGHARRLTEWASTAPQTAFTTLAAATAILDSVFTTGDPETLIRVVGNLNVLTDQTAGNERPFGAVGLCVVSNQAVAIGVTAIPTPYTDAESDLWVQHAFWAAPFSFVTGGGIANVSVDIDMTSKAMRKVSPDETLCLVIENGNSGQGCFYRLDVRVLSKVA